MTSSTDWTILVIDDEADIREVMTMTLEDAGYRVITAADGAAGLAHCTNTAPQIVITDIRMPGMDGLDVLRKIKTDFPDIEVIVVTAFGEMDIAIRALQLDASDFITKPVNDEALHLALDRARNRYESRKQLSDYTALLEMEKARTTQELVKSVAFQRNLIESSMDGILACDETGIVVVCNRSMERLLDATREEVIHIRHWNDFFSPTDARQLKEHLAGKKYGGKNRLFLYETIVIDTKNKTIPVQVSAVQLRHGQENAGQVGFFRDLREMRALEREVEDQARILHQDKMMSLGKLAASVVHEINNPLSGILNYIRLMTRILRRGPLPDDRRDKFMQYLDLVENETDRCAHIVSSLLAFSRKSPATFESVSIEELILRSTALSRHKLEMQNIALESSVEPGIPAVTGDFNQLQQCMINLIFNAIDAMPGGGTLTIEGRLDKANNQVRISVTDTGQGIADADRPHLFEPFFTTKKEGYGVGLGLSTLFGIVERHHGTVDVESLLGKGATFILSLPTG
ncbi:MAG: response regulator [Desulfobacterales bacterium]|nr:response regulator [Desulfobacterales bacterium]